MRAKTLLTQTLIVGRPSPYSNPPHEEVWRKKVQAALRKNMVTLASSESASVSMSFFINKDRIKNSDLDNHIKLVVDEMVNVGLIRTDKMVYEIQASKNPTLTDEGAVIAAWEWE